MNGPVGIVGAGYVGLPLAQVFAEAGRQVLLVEIDEDTRRRHQPWRELRQGRPLRGTAAARRSGHAERHLGLRPPQRGGGDPDRVADAAVSPARAGPLDRARRRRADRATAPEGAARRPGVDDLPRHDERAPAAAAGVGRPQGGRGLLPRLLARASRPGPRGLDDSEHAQDRRRHHARLHAARRSALRERARERRARLLAGGRRADEAAGEHLPLGEHRARQRARAALRPDETSTSGRSWAPRPRSRSGS